MIYCYKKTINDFDLGFQPNINRTEILDLCTLRFMDINNNILFIGNSRVGETQLAIAICFKQFISQSTKSRKSTWKYRPIDSI
ncbi:MULTISPECIES: ATP-binding protein [Enterococcus]|uniref:ATP-binding protein n=1 Tax=Enterococcus TaxID=1350 RepID=UPI002B4B9DAD|nr:MULTISPECIES: ATP-binding protein [Enterococcus]